MNITRDVITDLYPLYESGEASPDTRALVAEFLATDPEFAANINKILSSDSTKNLDELNSQLPKELEMQTLNKTRALLKKRSLYMAFAFTFTGLTFAFTFDSSGVRWIWSNAILGSVACALIALLFWVLFLNTRRTLTDSQI
jgi:anti-sigma factor RsiW